MMVFTSIYGVVDGFFISNFTGKTAFAAVNLIMPFLMVLGSFGFMMGAGGTAIVSKLLGEGNREDANKLFSLFVYATAVGGVVFAIVGELILPYMAVWLGATEEMYPFCITYGRILLITVPFFMLQNVFQSFFSTAERPALGFVITVFAGCTNIALDGILVGAVKMGVTGAAVATCISQFVGAVLPLFYFFWKNNSLLRLGRPRFSIRQLAKACSNGISEFVSNVSGSVVSIVFNFQLMRLAGENGVSAYGVMMYVCFIYVAIFIGYAIGVAPIIGYNYGAGNRGELKNVFKKSMVLMGIFGILMTALSLAIASPVSKIYVGYDRELFEMTKNAFYIFSFSFLFSGFSIFASSMFTAFGNGLISAIISFLRTMVFQIAAVLILPIFFGVTGVWVSMLVADVMSTAVAMSFCFFKRKKYGYAGKDGEATVEENTPEENAIEENASEEAAPDENTPLNESDNG